MSVEVQLTTDTVQAFSTYQTIPRLGQKITISNQRISSLAFKLTKIAGATGDITMTIRKTSDGSAMASKVWGDASALPLHDAGIDYSVWCPAVFDTAILVNEEVYICVEYDGGATDTIYARINSTSAKAGELAYYYNGSAWLTLGAGDADMTYYYVYTANPVLNVSTLAMSDVTGSTATGNGRIASFGTDGSCTQHGHCWSTSANPTTADTKTTLGVKSTLGPFTSSLTGLTPGTTYHARAYATDTVNTYYGTDITFVGGEEISALEPIRGNIAVVGEYLCYVALSGKTRKLLGDEY